MPVSDIQRLYALAQQLVAAGVSQDWERLAQLDQLLNQWMALRSDADAANPAVQDAWQWVAIAHAQSRKACQQALQEAGARLRDLHNHNEAHKAYAWQEQLS